MICERCKKHPVSFIYEENINGQKKKYVLCRECAEELKRTGEIETGFGSTPLSFFSGEGEDLFSTLFGGMAGPAPLPRAKRCPLCGISFAEIVERGKVGCADCYRVFSEELAPTLYRMHGDVRHRGRTPQARDRSATTEVREKSLTDESNNVKIGETPAVDLKIVEIESLRAALQNAIAVEAFEEAAAIRDKIRALETAEKSAGETASESSARQAAPKKTIRKKTTRTTRPTGDGDDHDKKESEGN